MVTPRINYAHLGATVNPRHLASLVSFFEAGSKSAPGGFGVEIEHLPVRNGSDEAVNYYEPQGVETLLGRLRPYYDADREYWENGRLVGLAREGISISLEPGAQVECSIGVLRTPEELETAYRAFRSEADPILDELGFRLVAYGYQPKTGFADIPVDAIAKLRMGTAVGPILAWFFRNTPYFEGAPNPFPLLRQRMWDSLDFQRTNVIPGLYDPRFGWEDYAVDVLSTPLMFADLTHTPEAAGLSDAEKHRAAFRENAGELYPDRELNAYEINHVISTHFNDARLKNFIEFRHWDSLPLARAERLTQIIGSLFYDGRNLARLASFFEGIDELDVYEAKANIQAFGAGATPYGRSWEFWREFLGLGDLLEEIPGDPAHPNVFQI
jgi:glutamate--cysteine ligase